MAARIPAIRGTREVDLLVEITADRLLQVEYETQLRRELPQRMLEYRSWLMGAYPGHHLTQVVLALDGRRPAGRDHPLRDGFRLGLRVLRMSRQNPQSLLARPGLAPLAILGDTRAQGPDEVYRQVLRQIAGATGLDREAALITPNTLATSVLSLATMEELLREEAMLSEAEIIQGAYDAPLFGRLLREKVAQAQDRGREKGREKGREEGREEGLEEAYRAMLIARFGDFPEVAGIARRLAELPRAQAARAVLAADSLENVLTPGR